MTVASTVSRVDYTGNGATATYGYTFRITNEDDLLVTVREVTTGVETTLTKTTDYTVTGVGALAGGNVVLVNASQVWLSGGFLTSSYTIIIRRVVDLTQETDIRNQGSFFPETHEDVFDKLTFIAQQHQDEIDRSIKLPETIDPADFDASLPGDITDSDSAGKAVIINADSDGFDLSEASFAGSDALFLRDIVYIAFADSPYTITSSHRGKLISVDTSGGAVTINLPAISGLDLTEAFAVAIRKQTSDTNAVTVAPNGSETIDKVASSKTLVAQTQGMILVPDTDTSPDDWQTLETRRVAVAGDVVGTSDTQTLTNKTLTSPVVTGLTGTISQGTDIDLGTAANTSRLTVAKNTLANLTALTRKEGTIVYATDTDKFYKDDGTSLTEIGSGSGGSINYIGNPDAESGTTGWTAYADAAATSPVNGTGGSPTVTITRTTTTPLRGTGSFLITKDASDRQGEGVSYDFTIDSADKAKVLNVSFDYEIASGTFVSGDSSDIRVWIYDVTNTVLIPVSPYTIQGGSGQHKFTGVFQTSSNSTSYRLILHCATTSASAYTFEFDNVVVGPQIQLFGAPITDWKACTVTGSWVSGNETYTAFKRRVGDSYEYDVTISLSGLPTATNLSITLDATIDTAKLSSGTSTEHRALGNFTVFDTSGGAVFGGRIAYGSTTTVVPWLVSAGSTYEIPGTNVTESVPVTFASGDKIIMRFLAPIVGLSSSVEMSNDTDTRIVAAKVSGDAASASTTNPIIFPTAEYDTHGAYSVSTGLYTVPVSGTYVVAGYIAAGAAASIIHVYVNSTSQGVVGVTHADSVTNVYGQVKAVAGDTISLRPVGSSLDAGSQSNVSIHKLSGPSAIAASEKVYLQYTNNGGTSITADTTNLDFSTKVVDSHGAWSGTVFTAPRSGMYTVHGSWKNNASTSDTTNIYKSTTKKVTVHTDAAANNVHLFGGSIYLLTGETISIRITGSRTLSDSATDHWISIYSQG